MLFKGFKKGEWNKKYKNVEIFKACKQRELH